jgi:hypothetical protein
MLSLVTQSTHELARALASPGGFAWWYADFVDEDGRTLVLIWSFGLPFLPGSRARALPTDRPALSLATYEPGRCTFYLLQTYAPDAARVEGEGRVRLGDSRFGVTCAGVEVGLEAELDVPLPGGAWVRGVVHARGPGCLAPAAHAGTTASPQRWAPTLAAATGYAELRTSCGGDFRLRGRAYVDGNTSTLPLHELGIASWRWGRVALPGRDLIFYFVDPEGSRAEPVRLVLEVDREGRLVEHRVSSHWFGARRDGFGLRFHSGLRLSSPTGLDVELRFSSPIDRGPFYLRFALEAATRRGERGRGLAELAVPKRVDLAWQRPFIRMRTHATQGPNSAWLPLFCGPADGRVRRWLAQRLPARAAAGVVP